MKKSLRNLNTRYILIAVIVLIVLICSIPYINSKKSNEYDFGTDHNKEYIEQFIQRYNEKNPESSFDLYKKTTDLGWKRYYQTDNKINIEIIANNDKKAIITVDTYEDKTELGKLFCSILAMFVSNTNLDSVWAELTSEDHKEMEYQGTKLTYNDSGELEVLGRTHYKWVKIEANQN